MSKENNVTVTQNFFLGFFGWLGGAVYVAHAPGYGFWDGIIWPYYVGRYIAMHFALLTPI